MSPGLVALLVIVGLAILLVLIWHYFTAQLMAAPNQGRPAALRLIEITMLSWSGVDLFFVLSGFLLFFSWLGIRERNEMARSRFISLVDEAARVGSHVLGRRKVDVASLDLARTSRVWLRGKLHRRDTRHPLDRFEHPGGADAAIQPHDMCAEALELRGLTRYLWWLQGYAVSAESLSASERDLRDAVAESPSRARAWWRLSQLLRLTGRFAEAGDAAARALEADAFLLEARGVYRTLYFAALNLGQYDAARDWCAQAGARFPGDREFAHCELRILGWSGRGRSAIARASRLMDSLDAGPPPERDGVFAADRRLLLSVLYARSGAAERARALLGEARVAAGSDTSAAWFLLAAARVHVLLDDRATALALIERTLAAAPQQRDFVKRVSWFNSLHDDAAFARLIEAQR